MELKIRETESGQFELVESVPIVIASFSDKVMARKVMLLLAEEATGATQEKKPATSILPPVPATPQPAPKAEPNSPDQETDKGADWTPLELDRAIATLEEGGSIKDVAAHFGKSMHVLRGKWAAHMRTRAKKAEASTHKSPAPVADKTAPAAQLPSIVDKDHPLTKVKQSIEELSEQSECRLCGKPFTQTADQLDLCARCSHA